MSERFPVLLKRKIPTEKRIGFPSQIALAQLFFQNKKLLIWTVVIPEFRKNCEILKYFVDFIYFVKTDQY
jgi:hypothetical protein